MDWKTIDTIPENEDVLVYGIHDNSGKELHIAGQFQDYGFYMQDGDEVSHNVTITHWMPLPKSPAA